MTIHVGMLRHQMYLPSEPFIPSMARALDGKVTMFARDPVTNAPPDLESVDFCANSAATRLRYSAGDTRPLERCLQQHGIDVLHAHFGVEGFASIRAARRLGIPHVTSLHGYDVSRSEKALITSGRPMWMRYGLSRRRFFAGGATTFICISEAVRQQALALGAPHERIRLIPNGVPTVALEASSVPDGRTILHVARLVEKKGTRVLIEAMREVVLRDDSARLRIIGDGPLRAELEESVRAYQLEDHVAFLGTRSHAEVHNEIRAARVLCVPSITAEDGDREGLPQIIVEASALGRPVVGTTHSGIPEAVVDGVTGLLVAENDSAGLARSLSAVLEDVALAQRMGEAGSAAIRERFDIRKSAAALEELYEELVRERIREE